MNFLLDGDGYTHVYVVGCYVSQSDIARHGIYYGPGNPNNDFGPCIKRATDDIAAIHAATFAIEQAAKLNIQKLRVFTDCEHLFDAVDGNIEMWRANDWCSLDDGQPLQNRDEYEELDRVMQSVPMDIEFELLDAYLSNAYLREAHRLTQHIENESLSELSENEILYVLNGFLENVIREAIQFAQNANRTIITRNDVLNSLRSLGLQRYSFNN